MYQFPQDFYKKFALFFYCTAVVSYPAMRGITYNVNFAYLNITYPLPHSQSSLQVHLYLFRTSPSGQAHAISVVSVLEKIYHCSLKLFTFCRQGGMKEKKTECNPGGLQFTLLIL